MKSRNDNQSVPLQVLAFLCLMAVLAAVMYLGWLLGGK